MLSQHVVINVCQRLLTRHAGAALSIVYRPEEGNAVHCVRAHVAQAVVGRLAEGSLKPWYQHFVDVNNHKIVVVRLWDRTADIFRRYNTGKKKGGKSNRGI